MRKALNKSIRFLRLRIRRAVIAVLVALFAAEFVLAVHGALSVRFWRARVRRGIDSRECVKVAVVGQSAGDVIDCSLLEKKLGQFLAPRRAEVIDIDIPADMNAQECREFFRRQLSVCAPDVVVVLGGIYDGLPSVEASWPRFVLSHLRCGRLLLDAGVDALMPLRRLDLEETAPRPEALKAVRAELEAELGIAGEKGWRYLDRRFAFDDVCEDKPQRPGYSLGDSDEAAVISRLYAIVWERPECVDAVNDLAVLLFRNGEHEEVLGLADILFEREPRVLMESAVPELCWSILDGEGRHGDNFTFEQRLLPFCRDYNRLLTTYNRMGFSLFAWKGFKEAERFYKELVLRYPDNPDSFLHLGQIYINAGRFSEAQKWAVRCLDSFRSMSDAYRDYACMLIFDSFLSLGRFEYKDAEWFWNGVSKWNVERDKYFSGMAVSLLSSGREAEAKPWFAKARSVSRRRFNDDAAHKYAAVAGMSAASGAAVVVMPYPMRSAVPLKRMLAGLADRLVFADASAAFKDAVSGQGYKYCFIDRVGADCGALSCEGRELVTAELQKSLLAVVEPEGKGRT